MDIVDLVVPLLFALAVMVLLRPIHDETTGDAVPGPVSVSVEPATHGPDLGITK
jgi:hypothetical protein